MCLHVSHICEGTSRDQKRMSAPLKQKLYLCGCWNQTAARVFNNSSPYNFEFEKCHCIDLSSINRLTLKMRNLKPGIDLISVYTSNSVNSGNQLQILVFRVLIAF